MAVPTTDSAMYQTMLRQPADLTRLLETGWEPARQAAGRLAAAGRVFVVGIGTSYHAALVGEWLLRAAGAEAFAVMSSDFAAYPEAAPLRKGDAVVVMAHTGVKRFSAEAMTKAAAAGATVLSVGSLTAEHPGSQLVLRTVEREKSAAFTASHLAAMTVLAQVATELGESRGAPGVASFRAALNVLPDRVAAVLPDAHVHRLGANPGFGAAANEVIPIVHGAAFHLLCHDDVALQPGAIQELVLEAFRSHAGIVGAKLVMWDDPGRHR